jgi:glyoxylase-like metal-dependent hydrolase (beta-lactamase superfamily II)/rhodanese-related sulfurtransferase
LKIYGAGIPQVFGNLLSDEVQVEFQQFYLNCLAHASYLIASHGVAAVVDPQRDVDIYLAAAQAQDLKIRYIFETHLHADFVSGHLELADRTGAQICVGAAAEAEFPHIALHDGDEVLLGKVRIKALETPGHTLESVCLVVIDEEKSAQPWAVLTGDTLFIGDVGRPDLSKTYTPQQLAAMLYDSLHNKLMTLPGETLVYPAHGAGSLCGRNMRAESFSTIKTERLINYALQIKTKDDFVRELTTNLPARPAYFLQDAEMNRQGAAALTKLPPLEALSAPELQRLLQEGATVLDIRPTEDFANGHIPGSICIALSGQFASWAGSVLGLSARPVLVAASDAMLEEARLRMARVGIEDLGGYLEGGLDAWKNAGYSVSTTPQISVQELRDALDAGRIRVLDVRRGGEWDAGHIENAMWHPLDEFKAHLPQLSPDQRLAVHCQGGYRSMIAISLLERAGFDNLTNVRGGFEAWKKAGSPLAAKASIG